MSGEIDLKVLLGSMDPELSDGVYVFHSMPADCDQLFQLRPWAIITETEGYTIIIDKDTATLNGIPVLDVFRRITLNVHSSLNAVGLTAVVSTKLAEVGISANVVAGFYHDHVFVQQDRAAEAMRILKAFNYSS